MGRGDLPDTEWELNRAIAAGSAWALGASTSRQRAGKGGCANAPNRSRGGYACRIHARCDNQGRPLGFVLTDGEASDYAADESR